MRGTKYCSAGFAVGIIAACILSAVSSVAEPWPQRTVRVVVPISAGSGPDVVARVFSARLAERWNYPVIVENRPGADGFIGTAAFIGARDDHALLYMTAAPITVYPLTRDKLSYDPARDLVPISWAASGLFAISVPTASKIGRLSELVSLARSQPGKLNYNAGVGQLPIFFEGFLHHRHLDMVLVSYRQGRSAVQDLAEGRLDVLFTVMASAMPVVNAGRVRYLAITNETRAPIAPEIETATEAGYPELTLNGLEGFFGWRDMPAELRDRISDDIQSVAADRTVSDRFAALGYVARGSTSAKFAAALEEQRAKVASILKMTGAKPQR